MQWVKDKMRVYSYNAWLLTLKQSIGPFLKEEVSPEQLEVREAVSLSLKDLIFDESALNILLAPTGLEVRSLKVRKVDLDLRAVTCKIDGINLILGLSSSVIIKEEEEENENDDDVTNKEAGKGKRESSSKHCILHRDMKPDNVLITEFLSCKITDFGTSRAKEANANITMSAVGTPLFCAPEIVRGEVYDESVDVYSFGLILLDMCVDGSLTAYIGEKWRVHHNKKTIPKQAMRFIRSMTEEGWRPLDDKAEDLPDAPKSIIALIHLCCDHDPKNRPSFTQILTVLRGPCQDEIRDMITFNGFDDHLIPKKNIKCNNNIINSTITNNDNNNNYSPKNDVDDPKSSSDDVSDIFGIFD
mmetsp:Transcript_27198/g.32130  ORF Transcript_27198/g.32130 Transcript_27198/m.32130 type:complete len:358 (-) Transcript_27198:107-1180(-)